MPSMTILLTPIIALVNLWICTSTPFFVLLFFYQNYHKGFDVLPAFIQIFYSHIMQKSLFKKAYVVPSAIVWNEDLDIAIEEVYEEGETITNNSKITANRKAKK